MLTVERLESLLQKTPLAELAVLQHAEPSLRLVEATAFPPGSVGAAVQTGMYDGLTLRAGDTTHRLTHVRLWSAEVTDLTPAHAAFAFLVIDDVRSVWPALPRRLGPDSRYPLDGGFWLPAARLDTFAAAVTTNARDCGRCDLTPALRPPLSTQSRSAGGGTKFIAMVEKSKYPGSL